MKKCVVISQPESKRQGCTTIDIGYSYSVSFPGGRVFRVPTDKGFPCAIAL
jgi:hypothetical protein